MPAGPRIATPSIECFFQLSLLGLVACAFCALADAGRLDTPSLLFLFAGLIWRGLMTLGFIRLVVPQRLITIVATAYLVFYPLDFYFLSHDFFAATAHGVCFLGVARVLSARTNRDYLYTGSLAFVALLGAAALSTNMRFFGWLIAAIVCALGALTSAEIRRGFVRDTRSVPLAGARTGWRLAVLVACAACGILVLTAGLFLLVPRTARAAAMLLPNSMRLTGFTNSIDLGGFGPIAKDQRPVLHIRSLGAPLPANLKWRGSALSNFDGRRWTEPLLRGESSLAQGTVPVADLRQRSRQDAERMEYHVDVTGSDSGALFIAGVPEFINVIPGTAQPPRLLQTTDDAFRALSAIGTPLSYEVSAQNSSPLPYPMSDMERRRYLALPFRLDSRIPELAQQWSDSAAAGAAPGGAPTDMERAIRIEQHLRNEYGYTLDGASLPAGRDRLADFLFVTRRGYCEYFASALAVLLRTQGIPTRVITGFQSGSYNDVSGAWVVRASDAHAWVEAWIGGRGWVTLDATPSSVAPPSGGVWHRIAMYFDAADTVWQQWVVNYNPGRQTALAFSFRNMLSALGRHTPDGTGTSVGGGMKVPSSAWIAVLLLATIITIGLFGPRLRRLWTSGRQIRRVRRGQGDVNDAALIYRRMLATLARRGYQKPEWFTPNEFARTLPLPEQETITAFTSAYNEVRFGSSGDAALRLAELLRTIESSDRKMTSPGPRSSY